MRSIGVITGSRADYGILRPLLHAIVEDTELLLSLRVTGMHLSAEFGATAKEIEADGFLIDDRIEMLISSDTPEGISKSMGLGTIGFSQSFSQNKPDILVVVGDRFEIHSAVLAALPFNLPVAHIHGGEETIGAFDNSLRQSISTLSHLHFPATGIYGQRLIHMGEEPWRVTVSGALSLDNIRKIPLASPEILEEKIGFSLNAPLIIVTYHSVTLEQEDAEWQIQELLEALGSVECSLLFTLPNADTNSQSIIKAIRLFVKKNSNSQLVENLGTQAYFSLMKYATAMVGNSSSGIIEAMSFELPVVNIGNRQTGRVRSKNVIDVGNGRQEVLAGIQKAINPEFRNQLRGVQNLYGDGSATHRILSRLKAVPLDRKLIQKRFMDFTDEPVQTVR